MEKPFSPSCERNQQPIFEVLSQYLLGTEKILELASGTGQHAVYFSSHWPSIYWQATDLKCNLSGIRMWLEESNRGMPAPKELDLSDEATWKDFKGFDAVYLANTLHIVSWPLVEKFCRGVKQFLVENGKIFIYGPFNYRGEFTSASNQEFDGWLKSRDPLSGIRDFEKVEQLLREQSIHLIKDHAMPANNRLLVFSVSQ